MIAIPAVDLRDGACVQLVGGSYADERIRLSDPVAVAADWAAMGFSRLHVVDLDAATGAGDNRAVIDGILGNTPAIVQVGGGVRTTERVDRLVRAGARSIVVGTRAIKDREWLAGISTAYPDRIIVAADVRGRLVTTHGWAETSSLDVADLVGELAELPLGGLLVTAVHREGLMEGIDLELMTEVARLSPVPVIASGGVTTMDDLRLLDGIGVSAAVIGMALYTGTLDARAAAQEFGR